MKSKEALSAYDDGSELVDRAAAVADLLANCNVDGLMETTINRVGYMLVGQLQTVRSSLETLWNEDVNHK